jgi:TolB protein
MIALRDYSGAVGDSTGYGQMDLDGSHYRRIANTDVQPIEYSPSNALAPQWIPGTAQLVHLRTIAGVTRLFVLDSTGATRRLINSPGNISAEAEPDVSGDGAWVYFVGHSPDGDAVWRVAASGGVPESLTTTPFIQYRSPSLSPDGNELVYVTSTFAGGQFEAYVRNLSTGDTRRLSANEAAGTRWSPTGEWILYAVSGPYAGYSGHLRLVRPDGTDDHELSDGAYYPGGTWSPDGRYVLVVRAEIGTHPELIDVTTGSRLPLVYARVWYGPAWRR